MDLDASQLHAAQAARLGRQKRRARESGDCQSGLVLEIEAREARHEAVVSDELMRLDVAAGWAKAFCAGDSEERCAPLERDRWRNVFRGALRDARVCTLGYEDVQRRALVDCGLAGTAMRAKVHYAVPVLQSTAPCRQVPNRSSMSSPTAWPHTSMFPMLHSGLHESHTGQPPHLLKVDLAPGHAVFIHERSGAVMRGHRELQEH